jgi:hypothetical protein
MHFRLYLPQEKLQLGIDSFHGRLYSHSLGLRRRSD